MKDLEKLKNIIEREISLTRHEADSTPYNIYDDQSIEAVYYRKGKLNAYRYILNEIESITKITNSGIMFNKGYKSAMLRIYSIIDNEYNVRDYEEDEYKLMLIDNVVRNVVERGETHEQ